MSAGFRFTVAAIAVLVMAYLIVAFVLWEPSPAAWTTYQRAIMAIFGTLAALVTGFFAAVAEPD